VIRIRDGIAIQRAATFQTMPLLEASGLDFSTGARSQALDELLVEYDVQLDPETQAFFVPAVSEGKMATIALHFVAFSLRIRDFLLMTEARVASSFRDDVARRWDHALPSASRKR
jgi:hypothetical protein